METLHIAISGMNCGHCVAAVKRELARLPGVMIEEVQIGSAVLRYDPQRVSTGQIEAAVAEAGFRVSR